MKTAIVTGASGNLGKAVVEKFISEGYKVFGTVLSTTEQFNYPAENFEAVVVDLLNEESSQKFVEDIITKQGSIDAAILTVGGFAMGSIAETSTTDILKQYKLNFETSYNIARPVFLQMLKQDNGRIFFIGSKPGLNADMSKGMIAYGLAKSLVTRLAELMNAEAKHHNVVTSLVVPSTIDTTQNRQAMPGANFNDWVKPGDIANIIYLHTTSEAKALRETVIKVYNNA